MNAQGMDGFPAYRHMNRQSDVRRRKVFAWILSHDVFQTIDIPGDGRAAIVAMLFIKGVITRQGITANDGRKEDYHYRKTEAGKVWLDGYMEFFAVVPVKASHAAPPKRQAGIAKMERSVSSLVEQGIMRQIEQLERAASEAGYPITITYGRK